jgi:dethiobiotin synthetase
MCSRFFVTGTDTGVGKTVASALLCLALDAIYWKPIQTGTREGSDRNAVLKLTGFPRNQTLPEVYRFAPAVSPHLAAQRAGVRIDPGKIRLPGSKNGKGARRNRNLIVEGAGGVLVPINARYLMVDLMKQLALPVVLVSRTSLGTINHTLLSLAALRLAGLGVRGVILAGKENRENRKAIEYYGGVRVVGWIPFLKKIDRSTLLGVFNKEFDAKAFAS